MKIKRGRKETVINNFVDASTGELLDTTVDVKHHKIYVNDRESFSMIFSAVIGVVDDLDRMSIRLIVWCSQNCIINKNVINLGKVYRASICSEFGVEDQTVKNAVVTLSKKGVLIPIGRGTYQIHPRYFWKGDMGSRNQALKYILEVEFDKIRNT